MKKIGKYAIIGFINLFIIIFIGEKYCILLPFRKPKMPLNLVISHVYRYLIVRTSPSVPVHNSTAHARCPQAYFKFYPSDPSYTPICVPEGSIRMWFLSLGVQNDYLVLWIISSSMAVKIIPMGNVVLARARFSYQALEIRNVPWFNLWKRIRTSRWSFIFGSRVGSYYGKNVL